MSQVSAKVSANVSKTPLAFTSLVSHCSVSAFASGSVSSLEIGQCVRLYIAKCVAALSISQFVVSV